MMGLIGMGNNPMVGATVEMCIRDRLGECVEGSLPRYDKLDVRTLGLLEINGLSSLKETTLYKAQQNVVLRT